MSLNMTRLRIVRDACTLRPHTCKVHAVEDQPFNPFIFACLAPLCQPPRQLDDPRGGEVTGTEGRGGLLGFGHCSCLYLSAGDSGRMYLATHLSVKDTVLSIPHMVACGAWAISIYIPRRPQLVCWGDARVPACLEVIRLEHASHPPSASTNLGISRIFLAVDRLHWATRRARLEQRTYVQLTTTPQFRCPPTLLSPSACTY